MATFSIKSSPVGSQLVETISGDEPADLNDFDVFITADENVTLTESDVTVSSGSSIVAFSGSNASYKATIRPPETSGTVTVEIAANAVPEGNPATSKDIRVSTSFPDTDAQVPSSLFTVSNPREGNGITVSPNRIILNFVEPSADNLKFYTFNGTEQTAESIRTGTNADLKLDYFNESVLMRGFHFNTFVQSRYSLTDGSEIASLPIWCSC